jgi:glycosyltransferase involved in cell wall biosynthesis
MKIAFFGISSSFNYFNIGGAESFARRLAHGLVKEGHKVGFVMYGNPIFSETRVAEGVSLYNFDNLEKALDFIKTEYDHILTIYLYPRDRLRYLWFRRANRHSLFFHQIYLGWPDSPLKRQAVFLDARLYPFNGRLICISPRQFEYASRWCSRTVLLIPPVVENYFLEPGDKPQNDQIRITYIGRTESGKGIEEAISLFTRFKNNARVHGEIHGLYHKNSASSRKIHDWLNEQDYISYYHIAWEDYTPSVDENLQRILKNTDILMLPYRKLSSTMDTPMLLLEGMASLCAIIIPAQGNIPDIYGPSPFIFIDKEQIAETVNRVLNSPKLLEIEQNRIFQRNTELGFKVGQVTERLVKAIS